MRGQGRKRWRRRRSEAGRVEAGGEEGCREKIMWERRRGGGRLRGGEQRVWTGAR